MAGNYELDINREMDSDMNNLRLANQALDEAKAHINRLSQEAGGMKGRPGQAIAAKAAELQKKIDALKDDIEKDRGAIRRAKEEYEARDRESARRIGG